ncbi:MAG: hypothetical protein PUJ51_22430 [Clostridiales bacterium]|uniref:hypothetical protein n=1 Tax=Terrisporobacter sp. TaxID=1965305 RepID=UPI002A55DD43|nr:hypothetical protein [Terrisporobacter sp.]MDD7757210.1 hypothetical protein [Clostridiales bacterium]MDY4134441.1 hypothetical protein [Terrisporobacter sp.]
MLIQIKEINQQNITDILYGKPCFYSLGCIFNEKIINYWKQNILKEKLGHYHNAPLIAKIDMAYYETINNEKLKKEYFENAKYWNDILRNACFPYILPIDYIISLFDIIWNKGCKRAVFNNRKTFAGLVRVLTENLSIEPHQDIFKRDDEITLNDNGQIKEQIAFNFFLDNAEDGGEIELWNWKPSDDEYRKFQHTNIKLNYGIEVKFLYLILHINLNSAK